MPAPLFHVVGEVEEHVAEAGWDQPPALFALVDTGSADAMMSCWRVTARRANTVAFSRDAHTSQWITSSRARRAA